MTRSDANRPTTAFANLGTALAEAGRLDEAHAAYDRLDPGARHRLVFRNLMRLGPALFPQRCAAPSSKLCFGLRPHPRNSDSGKSV